MSNQRIDPERLRLTAAEAREVIWAIRLQLDTAEMNKRERAALERALAKIEASHD
jgi:hypothetical protein